MEPCLCGAEDCPACGRLQGTWPPAVELDEPDPRDWPELSARRQDDLGTAYFQDRLMREPRGI